MGTRTTPTLTHSRGWRTPSLQAPGDLSLVGDPQGLSMRSTSRVAEAYYEFVRVVKGPLDAHLAWSLGDTRSYSFVPTFVLSRLGVQPVPH